MRRFFVGLLVFISAVCLIGSSLSLWTRRHVINTGVFVSSTQKIIANPAIQARVETAVATQVLATPQVKQTISQAVDALPPRLHRFQPSIENGASTLVTRAVHILLTSAAFERLTSAALTSAHTQLVNGQSVTFNIGQAKAAIPPDRRTGLAGQVLNLIPNNVGVTVLTKSDAPQVYTMIDALKVLWLWLGLGMLGLLIGAIVLSRNRRGTVRAWAVTSVVLCLIFLLVLRLVRGPLLGHVRPANVDAADALYSGVTHSLRAWTLWLVLILAGITVVTILWGRIGIIPALQRGYEAAKLQTANYREQRAQAKAAAALAGPDGTAIVPAKQSWWERFVDQTKAFVDGLNLPAQLSTLAAFIQRNLKMVRWAGTVLGALILLFWPSPSLSVLIWVAAFVALYLGLLELILNIAARAPGAQVSAAGDGPITGVPTTGNGPTTDVPTQPIPTVRTAAAAPAPATAPAPVATAPAPAEPPRVTTVSTADLSALGGRLDLLMRLDQAHTAGVLNDDEYAQEKARLMALGATPAG